MTENRNVKVKPKTHERLKKHGNYDDTMNDIITRLLDFYESEHGKE